MVTFLNETQLSDLTLGRGMWKCLDQDKEQIWGWGWGLGGGLISDQTQAKKKNKDVCEMYSNHKIISTIERTVTDVR